jgi:hypothetical protein
MCTFFRHCLVWTQKFYSNKALDNDRKALYKNYVYCPSADSLPWGPLFFKIQIYILENQYLEKLKTKCHNEIYHSLWEIYINVSEFADCDRIVISHVNPVKSNYGCNMYKWYFSDNLFMLICSRVNSSSEFQKHWRICIGSTKKFQLKMWFSVHHD